jgi:hypothetical protein
MTEAHGRGAGLVNFATGATTEIAKRSGAGWAQHAQTGGLANRAGHQAVAGAVVVGAKVAAVAAAAPFATALVGVAAVGAGGYALYRLFKRS